MTRDEVQRWSARARELPPKHRLRYLLIDLGLMAKNGGEVSLNDASFSLWEREAGIEAMDACLRLAEAATEGWLVVVRRRGLSVEIELIP